jgi:hypothetical protein
VSTNRTRAAATLAWLGLALASNARALDLRDWGKKYPAAERFVVLPMDPSISNVAVPALPHFRGVCRH